MHDSAAAVVQGGGGAAPDAGNKRLITARRPWCREEAERHPTLASRLLRALLRAPTLARPDGTNWEELYQRVGACLGQMGALDPSKVRLEQSEPVKILEDRVALTGALLRPIVQQLRVANRISLVEICMYSVQMMMPGARRGRLLHQTCTLGLGHFADVLPAAKLCRCYGARREPHLARRDLHVLGRDDDAGCAPSTVCPSTGSSPLFCRGPRRCFVGCQTLPGARRGRLLHQPV